MIKNKDNQIFLKNNIKFFSSEEELQEMPIKMYSIDEKWGSIAEHTHDYIQIWYVRKGEFIHSIGNKKEYKMVRGNLYVMPPFAVHEMKIKPGEKVQIIGCEFLPEFINDQFGNLTYDKDFFDFAYIEPFLVSEDKIQSKIILVGKIQAKVESLLEEMLQEYNERNKYYEILLKGDLLKLLSIIIREYHRGHQTKETKEIFQKYRDAIIESIQYIDNHYDEEIHLDDLCHYSMMSKTYFCYVFKKLTGKTFNDYLNTLRIQKATEMLTHADQSVTEVCYKVGFNDLTHFSRTFKKYMGISPKYYQKSVLDI